MMFLLPFYHLCHAIISLRDNDDDNDDAEDEGGNGDGGDDDGDDSEDGGDGNDNNDDGLHDGDRDHDGDHDHNDDRDDRAIRPNITNDESNGDYDRQLDMENSLLINCCFFGPWETVASSCCPNLIQNYKYCTSIPVEASMSRNASTKLRTSLAALALDTVCRKGLTNFMSPPSSGIRNKNIS